MAKSVAKIGFVIACGLGGTAVAQPGIEADAPDLSYALPSPTGAWLDFGVLYGRVEPTAGTTLSTEMFRFGPRASLNRFFYVGAELDVGRISGQVSSQTDFARSDSTTGGMTLPSGLENQTGTIAMAKAVVGARLLAGPFSGAAELAAGVRDYMTTDGAAQFGQGYFGGVYEAHGRLDFWVTPKLSVGALANVDLVDKNDVSVGLLVGFHFMAYDGQRSWR